MKNTILTIIIIFSNVSASSNDWFSISRKINNIYTERLAKTRDTNVAFCKSKEACHYDSLVVWYDEIRNQINFIDSLNLNDGDTLYFTEDFDIFKPFHSQAWKNRYYNRILVYKKYTTKLPLKVYWINEDVNSRDMIWRKLICNWNLEEIRRLEDKWKENILCTDNVVSLTYVFRVIFKQHEIIIDYFDNSEYITYSVIIPRRMKD